MVGCRRTAEFPDPVTWDSLSRSAVSTAWSAADAGSATASPVSMETELVPLPGSIVRMLEPLTLLLGERGALTTDNLCKLERLRLDTRDGKPPTAVAAAVALRDRPRDRVLLARES